MKNVSLIFLFVLFFVSLGAQSQKEALQNYTARGTAYLGLEGRPTAMGFLKYGRGGISLKLPTRVKFQYNLMNRLTIAGGIGALVRTSTYYNGVTWRNWISERFNTSVYVQYYPFKSNGLFVEGELTSYLNGLGVRGPIRPYHQLSLNPGYTIMVGKNKRIALELKPKFFTIFGIVSR